MNRLVGDEVVIVQDEDHVLPLAASARQQFIEQRRHQALHPGRVLGRVLRLERALRPASPCQARVRALQGGQQGGAEVGRLIVRRFEGELGEGEDSGGQPLGEQGGFAVASRGRQEDQGPLQALLQVLEQAGTS